jgi:hypothetical protein
VHLENRRAHGGSDDRSQCDEAEVASFDAWTVEELKYIFPCNRAYGEKVKSRGVSADVRVLTVVVRVEFGEEVKVLHSPLYDCRLCA